MLMVPPMPAMTYRVDNWTTNPSSTFGTALAAPGTANTEGSWTQVLSATAENIYWLHVAGWQNQVAAQARQGFFDVGVDPAGGSSYTEVVANLIVGGAAILSSMGYGKEYYFPLFIPAGSTVAMRHQDSTASVTSYASIVGYGGPGGPERNMVASVSETLGTVTNTTGTSFTPGNAADGSWVSLGTTTSALWWWQLGVQIDSTVKSTRGTYVDLAVGDSTTKEVILRTYLFSTTNEEEGYAGIGHINPGCYRPVPAGAELWVRGRNAVAPDSGFNALAYGFGG